MCKELMGRVVVSAAGRDKGKNFVIVTVYDSAFVAIADGDTRKVAKAKRKKLKHLRLTPDRLDQAALQLQAERGTMDAFLRKSLGRLCEDCKISKEG